MYGNQQSDSSEEEELQPNKVSVSNIKKNICFNTVNNNTSNGKKTYHQSIFCPFQFLKKVEDNRVDNFRALNEIMGKTITTP